MLLIAPGPELAIDGPGYDTMLLTQSVVIGAPLAINCRTSSAFPFRDASNNFFPKSATADDVAMTVESSEEL